MEAVLMSIQPKWVEKIASGEKTIEVRKIKPKLETPFKVYIYCTKDGLVIYGNGKQYVTDSCEFLKGSAVESFEISSGFRKWNGKVIGEFVCDRIEDFRCCSVPYKKENNLGYGHFLDNGVYQVNGWHEGVVFERNDRYIDSMLKNNELKEMCLSAQEIFDYIGMGKHLYGWHISDLKIYDKPKELGEFSKPFVLDDRSMKDFCHNHCEICDEENCKYDLRIKRPPQSWCYVED